MPTILRPVYYDMGIEVFTTTKQAKKWMLEIINEEDIFPTPSDELKERVNAISTLKDFEKIWKDFNFSTELDYTLE